MSYINGLQARLMLLRKMRSLVTEMDSIRKELGHTTSCLAASLFHLQSAINSELAHTLLEAEDTKEVK